MKKTSKKNIPPGNQKIDISPVSLKIAEILKKYAIHEDVSSILQMERLHAPFSMLDDQGISQLIPELMNLNHLREIVLMHSKVTGKSLKSMSVLPFIDTLIMDACNFSENDFSLISEFSALKDLRLNETEFDDRASKYLEDLTSLVWLELSSTKITHMSLKHISKLTKLQTLKLARTDIYGPMKELKNLTFLKNIDLSYTGFDDEAAKNISSMHDLERADLEMAYMADDGLAYFSGLKKLSTLNIPYSEVSGFTLHYLSECRSLAELNLARTNLTSEGLRDIGKIKSLRLLVLSGNDIDDDCIPYLLPLQLNVINVDKTKISKKGKETLKKKNPSLSFWGDDEEFQDKGVMKIPKQEFIKKKKSSNSNGE